VQAAAAITRARGILKIAANLPVILSSSNVIKREVYGGGDAGRQFSRRADDPGEPDLEPRSGGDPGGRALRLQRPGGPSDVVARIVADGAGEALGQSVTSIIFESIMSAAALTSGRLLDIMRASISFAALREKTPGGSKGRDREGAWGAPSWSYGR
jgi:hypothetical protein